jgi:hypothetical protein
MHEQTRRVIDLFLATTWGMFVDSHRTGTLSDSE